MARPLSKRDKKGVLYKRPAEIEAAIDAASRLNRDELLARLATASRGSSEYLPSEVLVNLVRNGRKSGDHALFNTVLPALLRRCEAILLVKVEEGAFRDAATVREDALGSFAEMFATDGTDDCHAELDFFECRFNLAFRAFRIDFVRPELERETVIELMPEQNDEESNEPAEESFARVESAYRTPAVQEENRFREELTAAIEALPSKERSAFSLVYLFDFQEESDDPMKATAATLCGCTGRTIRNRLKSAKAKLARFKDI